MAKRQAYRDEFAWAAAHSTGDPYPFILPHSTRCTRSDVADYMGEVWKHPGETNKQGWRRAYRAGARIVRVRISLAFLNSHEGKQ